MPPPAFANPIESNYANTDYEGTLDAHTFEITPPGQAVTSHLIRTDQNWGIHVDWEMDGNLVNNLDETFQVQAFLEIMDPSDMDVALPAAPVNVGTLSVPLQPGPPAYRVYSLDINVAPNQVPPGLYKVTTTLQLFDTVTLQPWPVAGFVEGPMIRFYNPGP